MKTAAVISVIVNLCYWPALKTMEIERIDVRAQDASILSLPRDLHHVILNDIINQTGDKKNLNYADLFVALKSIRRLASTCTYFRSVMSSLTTNKLLVTSIRNRFGLTTAQAVAALHPSTTNAIALLTSDQQIDPEYMFFINLQDTVKKIAQYAHCNYIPNRLLFVSDKFPIANKIAIKPIPNITPRNNRFRQKDTYVTSLGAVCLPKNTRKRVETMNQFITEDVATIFPNSALSTIVMDTRNLLEDLYKKFIIQSNIDQIPNNAVLSSAIKHQRNKRVSPEYKNSLACKDSLAITYQKCIDKLLEQEAIQGKKSILLKDVRQQNLIIALSKYANDLWTRKYKGKVHPIIKKMYVHGHQEQIGISTTFKRTIVVPNAMEAFTNILTALQTALWIPTFAEKHTSLYTVQSEEEWSLFMRKDRQGHFSNFLEAQIMYALASYKMLSRNKDIFIDNRYIDQNAAITKRQFYAWVKKDHIFDFASLFTIEPGTT